MTIKYFKTLVCLANSRKISGRCIAGKEIDAGEIGAWLRPVSGRPMGELSEEERRYQNGEDPKLLDVIRIPMVEPRPHAFQTENHLIDDRYYWSRERKATWHELEAALDPATGALWQNASSSYNGVNDRIDESTANALDSSLRLVEVDDLKILVAVEGADFDNAKRRVRGRFNLNNARYCLSVTDPVIERTYLAEANGEFTVGRAILCISLGEPYGGYAYKLIAGVFVEP